MKPDISVLLPVYNGKDFLVEAVESTLSQEDAGEIEVIVLNDGSNDGSIDLIKNISDRRLIISSHRNMGLAATLNKGLSIARGRYIARQDQDDLLLQGRLSKQLDFLEKNPQVAIVGTWAEIWVGDQAVDRFHLHPSSSESLSLRLNFDNPFVHSSIMMRAESIRKLGGYSQDFDRQPPEDYELWSRVARHHRIANIPEVLTIYREVPKSMSRAGHNPFIKNVLKISSENIYSKLSDIWEYDKCLNLTEIYHYPPNLSFRISTKEAEEMVERLTQISSEENGGMSEDLLKEAARIKKHIRLRFIQQHLPSGFYSPLKNLAKRLLFR